MAVTTTTWSERFLEIAGERLQLLEGGQGDPLLVLHRDTGNPGWLPCYDRLAERFTVLLPSHPGYGGSDRPAWLRSARDVAVIYQWLLADLDRPEVALLGLGLGGWIAAEMATMAPRAFRKLVLVGAMGLKPPEGEIFDQALVNYIEYVRAGFHDQGAFDRQFGAEPDTDQLIAWDLSREMTFRLAWKPYLYSQTLPYLLGGVRASALVIWGEHDRIVPRSAGRRYVEMLRSARLEIVPASGHHVEIERPDALAALVTSFVAGS
jgi:pimeloyl-ACP methyl ester carboxylesterase